MIKDIKAFKENQNPAGIVRLKSGVHFDLQNPAPSHIYMDDIAWSLSRQVRYNGHIPFAFTVARHSILMSYVVHPEYAMEALLHDSGEAYLSDVVYPLKRLLPQIEVLEDTITAMVMNKYNLDYAGGDVYQKSEEVSRVDYEAYQWECFKFDRADGVPHSWFNTAQIRARKENGLMPMEVHSMATDYSAFLHRFWQLFEPMFARQTKTC